MISNLTEAVIDLVSEDEDSALDEELLEPPPFNPVDIGLPPFPFRKRRQAADRMRFLDDDDLIMALENENACNPVLRASAISVVEEAERQVYRHIIFE